MKTIYHILLLSHLALNSPFCSSKELTYKGLLSFKAETNIPNVSIQGKSEQFQTLKVVFNDDNSQLLKITAIIDTNTILPTLFFSNHKIYGHDFSTIDKQGHPIYLKMSMDKIFCIKQSSRLISFR